MIYCPTRWQPCQWILFSILCTATSGNGTAEAQHDATKSPRVGITKRVPWSTSRVKGSPDPLPPFRTERVFPEIAFRNPVVVTMAPGLDRWFVGEQGGKIFSFHNDADNERKDLFLDVRDLLAREPADSPVRSLEALYGLTFHPRYAENRYCYVCYVVRGADGSPPLPEGTRVSRFKVTDTDPPRVDPASEQLVISWLQGGHNGGCLKFGPDGFLYISTGDGSNAFPPDGLNAGQDVTNLLSAVLRIDVDHPEAGRAYSIPPDNPLLNIPGARGEIWSYGLRNPWKMSFDRQTGDLWVGDVGWELWELVFRVVPGGNYGWSIVEGPQSVHVDRAVGPTPILPPALSIPHTDGVSVTGGFVYRGKKFPELVGQYICGDWETRRVWAARFDGVQLVDRRDLVEPTVRIVDFAEDAEAELYLLDYDDGTLHRLAANPQPTVATEFPKTLSDTGLFANVPAHQSADGVYPFSANASQWSDGAMAERWVAVPGEGTIKILPQKQNVPGSMFQSSMTFPPDTVLTKTLSLATLPDPARPRRVETQLLHFDGRFWRGYSYAWNDEQTDATLVEAAGSMREFLVPDPSADGGRRRQSWRFASRVECARCHNQWAEYTLAFNLRQLNKDHDYHGVVDNQLRTLEHIGIISLEAFPTSGTSAAGGNGNASLPESRHPRFADPYDATADLNERARSYLHVNCAHCHRNGGGGTAYIELQYELPVQATKALGVKPSQGTFDIPHAEILAPGDPFRSVLFYRIATTGGGRMPHIGSEVVDFQGVSLIHDWIRQLPGYTRENELLERLAALDESTARGNEDRTAESRQRGLAREIARQRWLRDKISGGEKDAQPPPDDSLSITSDDRTAAEQLDRRQSDERRLAREKERTDLANQLLGSTSQALMLARAIDEGKLPPGTRDWVVRMAAGRAERPVRDLFERFLPDELRVRRLGAAPNAQALLALPGDKTRGRELFLNSNLLNCKTCHRVGNIGGKVGPDLPTSVKKLSRSQLLESILAPSQKIDPQYQTQCVITVDGRVLTGIIVARNEQGLVLRDAKDGEVRIDSAAIESVKPAGVSLMPDQLLRDLTAEQAADLLAYLESLRQVAAGVD